MVAPLHRHISLWVLALTAAAGCKAEPDRRSVSVCDDANEWPPYTYFERHQGQRSDHLTGFSVELLRQILGKHGIAYRIELLPWKRCLESVARGEEHLMLLNATRNPVREQEYLFSLPTYSTRTVYFWSRRVHPQGLKIDSQSDLRRYRIGGVHGYTYSQLDQIDMASLTRAMTYANLVQMLHRDRIDVLLVGEEVFQSLSSLGGYDFAGDAELGRAPLPVREPNRFHMLFSRKNPRGAELQALVNREIEALQRSGELRALLARHVGADPAPP